VARCHLRVTFARSFRSLSQVAVVAVLVRFLTNFPYEIHWKYFCKIALIPPPPPPPRDEDRQRERLMPRRTKTYIGPNKTLVDGGRVEVTNEGEPVTTLPKVAVDIDLIRKKLAPLIEQFDELSLLEDPQQFIKDLADECAWAQTTRLDHLTKGTRTKPDEWTVQILLRGLGSVMQRHGLKPAISQYYDRKDELRQSLYLRLIPELGGIAGCIIPKDVKGLALRAKRIDHEGVVRTQMKRRRRKKPTQVIERFSHKRTKSF
jgi:hypothetical protein